MGKNGSGKSTLSKCLVGHPDYEITEGSGETQCVYFFCNIDDALRMCPLTVTQSDFPD
jgi:ABC-type sugar transport system ATPase subunit